MVEARKKNVERKTAGFLSRERRSLSIALTGVIAAIYTISTLALNPISYQVINFRLSNILIGIVPIIGLPAVVGISLGVFLANTLSPLGPIDLISAAFSFLGLLSIHFLRKKSVLAGLAIYSALLSVWVTTELHIILGLPIVPTIYLISIGVSTVVIIGGYALYKGMKASGLMRRFQFE